jgi:predicted transcriptional regulator
MSTSASTSLERFHEFVGRQLRTPSTARMSPDEVFARWREQEETIAAIQEGLADVEAGRVFPVEDVLRELRSEFRLP